MTDPTQHDVLEVTQVDRNNAALDALRAANPLLAQNIINGFRDEYPLTQRRARLRQKATGRFADYTMENLAAQCRMQARDNLDPEYSQFMEAVAARLEEISHD